MKEDLHKLSSRELFEKLEKFTMEHLDDDSQVKVQQACQLMVEITADTKPRPDGSRIEHILRVTLKAIELGADSAAEIITALLHDSVEDQPKRLAQKLSGKQAVNVTKWSALRGLAYQYIALHFGEDIKVMVSRVTNPLSDLNLQIRHRSYIAHTEEMLTSWPIESRIRLGDHYDNGLNVRSIADADFRRNMCERYLPVYPLYYAAVKTGKISLSEEKRKEVLKDIKSAYEFAKNELGVIV